ncbi:MAG: class I SAM-dependent methyltransferase [Candidatus Nomurabacteria bacterium]
MRFEEKVEILRIKKHKGKETKEFLEDIKSLANGEAYEYLLGEVLFCDTKVDLSLCPMIPRPETEFWVKQAIENIRGGESFFAIRILDLFSGSGNVGLAILKNIPESSVDMIEFDPKLKDQIEISILKNNIKKTRTRILTGDTWEGAVGNYGIIFAVPPYVPPQMKDEVMEELHAEDSLSFFDKEDGYYYHKQVLENGKSFLKEGGTLYLEFDITQRMKIEELAKEFGWISYSFLKDPYGHEFVIKLKK